MTPGEKEREGVVLFPRGSCHTRRRRNLLRGITCSARARRKLYAAYSQHISHQEKKLKKLVRLVCTRIRKDREINVEGLGVKAK